MKKDLHLEIGKDWVYGVYLKELIGNESCVEWFDRETYKITTRRFFTKKQEKIFSENPDRFVKLLEFVDESTFGELPKLLNNEEVNEYFYSSKDDKEFAGKYRAFIDWNCIEDHERYRTYLIVYPLMKKWCEENNINYTHNHPMEKPRNYLYDDMDKLHQMTWEIPYKTPCPML